MVSSRGILKVDLNAVDVGTGTLALHNWLAEVRTAGSRWGQAWGVLCVWVRVRACMRACMHACVGVGVPRALWQGG